METGIYSLMTIAAFICFKLSAAETITGMCGIRIGEVPRRVQKDRELESLHANDVCVTTDDEESMCFGITDDAGKLVQLKTFMAYNDATRKDVRDKLTERYGEPSFAETCTIDDGRSVVTAEFETFVSGSNALSLVRMDIRRIRVRQANECLLFLYCTDIAAMTNLLAHADKPRDVPERNKNAFYGRLVGYSDYERKWATRPFVIGSDDRAWKLHFDGAEIAVVKEGSHWWIRRDGKWKYDKGDSYCEFSIGEGCFKTEINGELKDVRDFWLCDRQQRKKIKKLKSESVSADIANENPPVPMVGTWVNTEWKDHRIEINQDGTLIHSRGPRDVTKSRWIYRFKAVVALNERFDRNYDSYDSWRAVYIVSDDGNRLSILGDESRHATYVRDLR